VGSEDTRTPMECRNNRISSSDRKASTSSYGDRVPKPNRKTGITTWIIRGSEKPCSITAWKKRMQEALLFFHINVGEQAVDYIRQHCVGKARVSYLTKIAELRRKRESAAQQWIRTNPEPVRGKTETEEEFCLRLYNHDKTLADIRSLAMDDHDLALCKVVSDTVPNAVPAKRMQKARNLLKGESSSPQGNKPRTRTVSSSNNCKWQSRHSNTSYLSSEEVVADKAEWWKDESNRMSSKPPKGTTQSMKTTLSVPDAPSASTIEKG